MVTRSGENDIKVVLNRFFSMQSRDLRRRFIDFFVNKYDHTEISGASLVPENDPTVLFTTAGMHPLVPYFMGEAHPSGKRLVDAQKCVRTDDIDEVGDPTHLTFFEMMGNWSMGDYFKKEAIEMSYDFLTSSLDDGGLGLDPDMLAVSCFEGDDDAPKDEEAAGAWEKLGFTREEGKKRRIFFYNKKENWWGPAGQTGPCGPDSEMFYFTGDNPDPYYAGGPADNEEWVEIWNDVFMEYNKTAEGSFVPLDQKNVDTGLGLERMTAVMQGVPTIYETDLFAPIMTKISELSGKFLDDFTDEETHSARIMADHLRAATFILADPRAVRPSNTDQGYVLRRLIRRAVRHGIKLGIEDFFTVKVADVVIENYKDVYPELDRTLDFIRSQLQKEEDKFHSALGQGEKEFAKMLDKLRAEGSDLLTGELAFRLYDTYGFPLEMTNDLAKENGLKVDVEGYEKAFEAHQEKSRAGAEQKFHGGLADNHEETVKLHTATHLLHQALRDILGDHVYQQGSNITQQRLRFDFTHPEKLTEEQRAEVEARVNEAIENDVNVHYEMMTVEDAKDRKAIGLFPDRYDEKIKVYEMGKYSLEICGGPHVKHTNVLGKFRIKKEQSCAAGIRRIKAVVEEGESGIEFAEEKAD
jgi:alanyl-tRNA synthetase